MSSKINKNIMKKILSFTLTLVMAFALCLPLTGAAYAATEVKKIQTLSTNELSNILVDYDSQVERVTWDLTEDSILTEDVEVPGQMNFIIQLNGYALNLNGHHFVNKGRLYIFPGQNNLELVHKVYRNRQDGTLSLNFDVKAIMYYFEGGVVYGGKAENGGLCENYYILSCSDVTIALCESSGDGGVVYNRANGDAYFYGGRYYGNKANGNGGIIYNLGNVEIGMLKTSGQKGENILNTRFENNDAPNGYGGALYNAADGTVDSQGAIFSCDAAICGGAVYNLGEIDLENTKFLSNSASQDGGAIYNEDGGEIEFADSDNLESATPCFLTENKAEGNGGAVYNLGSLVTCCIDIQNNEAKEDGGAVYNDHSGVWTLSDGGSFTEEQQCIISNNKAGKDGGAVYNTGVMDCEDDSINTMEGNSAEGKGGAVFTNKDTILGGSPLNITKNTAGENGGAVYFAGGTLTLYENEININGNTVSEKENNIYIADGQTIVCDGFEGTAGVSFENPKNGLKFAEDYDSDDATFTADAENTRIGEKDDWATLYLGSGVGSAISGGSTILIVAAVAVIAVAMVLVAKKKKTAEKK